MRDSVLSKILRRGGTSTGLIEWIRLFILELYVGENLLDMLSNTSSYNNEQTHATFDAETNGWRRPLEDFIPATLINKFLKKAIIQLLVVKYIGHYGIMKSEESSGEIRYELNHANLHLLTELRLSYNTLWIITNVLVDVVVYIITSDLTAMLFSGAIVEALRRLKI